MTDSRKSVRYYIDRDNGTPVVRTVPVARSAQPALPRPSLEAIHRREANLATLHAVEASRRRGARHRIISLAKASVRRNKPPQ